MPPPAVSKVKRRDLKEDKVYLTIAGVADFFAKNRLWIALGALVVILAFAVGYYRNISLQRENAEASLALYQATQATGEQTAALKKVMTEYAGTSAAPVAMYELGNALYNEGHYDEALTTFKELLKQYPTHLFAPSTMEAEGYCYESLDKWKEAADAYETLIKKDASTPEAKRAYYRLGLCYERTGEKQKAIDAYKKVAELQPDSLWADYANERLASLSPSDVVAKKEPASPLNMGKIDLQ